MLGFPASYAHGSFAFNSHLDASGLPVEANVHTTVTIDDRQIDTSYRDLRDPLHLAQGGTLGRVHKGLTLIRLAGRIQGADLTQRASISDRERAMLAAFDPYLCYQDSPTTDGAYAFDFSEATLDETTYPTGIIALRYYARPTTRPFMREALAEGAFRQYAIALVAADPRCYEQTLGTLSLSSGTLSGAAVNRGNVAGPLKAVITMAGAGSSSFSITRSGVTFGCSLAGLSTGNVVTIIFETCGPFGYGRSIKVGSVEAFTRKSTAATTWLDVPVGSTTFTIANATNVTSCVLSWGHARA